jgi:hypothetical protein
LVVGNKEVLLGDTEYAVKALPEFASDTFIHLACGNR